MGKSALKLTGAVGVISALVFAGAFAAYNGRRTTEGGATNVVGCSQSTETRIFLSDYPEYASRWNRVVYDRAVSDQMTRDYQLPVTISPGQYEVRTISSDTHYDHRSDSPGQDVQDQPNEEYYLSIDGQRTQSHSTDFDDYYDWRGSDNELLQDDDNNGDTVPTVVRNTWQGEYLGSVTVANSTNTVRVEHSDVYDDMDQKVNSVIPSAILLTCLEDKQPSLEIQKDVDGLSDGSFDPTLQQSKEGETITWKVAGRNVGEGPDNAAVITSCAPQGTSYVADSTVVTAGVQSGTIAESGGCFTWTGPLQPGENVSVEFQVVLNDIETCDQADGAQDGKCTCIATIHSEATETTESSPADSDTAAVNQLLPSLSIIKKVDGSDENTTFSDISEQIIPDGRTVLWEIVAKNDGRGDLDNARVIDNYPGGVTVTGVNASVGSATTDGTTVIWDGALNSDDSVVITVESTINDVDAFNTCETADVPGNESGDGVCTNRAFVGEAEAGTNDGLIGDTKFDDAEVYAVLTPSLTVKKYVDGADSDVIYSDQSPELVEANNSFVWRVEGCNVGDAIEPTARIVDVVPAGVSLDDAASAVRVDGVAGSSAVSVVTDPATGRPAIAWNGSLDVGACVTIEYTSTIADRSAYETCLGVSTGTGTACGVDAYIGTATGDNAVSVDLLTRSSDPAFVDMEFVAVLGIEKFVDGNADSTFDTVVEQTSLNESFTWKIVAQNTGSGDEPNARIVDVLPANMELISTSADQVSVTLDGAATDDVIVVQDTGTTAVVWNGSMDAGSTVEMTFQARLVSESMLTSCVSETEGEHCRNTAEIGRRDVLSPVSVVGQTASDTADVFATPTGTLTITKEVDVHGDDSWSDLETAEFDTWFNWRISVSNQGDGTITNAAFLDVFPEGVVVNDVTTVSGNGDVELIAGSDKFQAFWTVPTFAPGETAEFVATAKIVDIDSFNACDTGTVDGQPDGLCANKAYVGTGANVEEFQDIDSDDAQVDVQRYSELYLSKLAEGSDSGSDYSDFEEVSVAGEVFQWKVTFGNSGTAVAENVQVVDPLPTGVVYTGHTATAGEASYDETTNRVTWNGSINPSEEVSLTIETRFDNGLQFIACDVSDGSEDANCVNTARLTHGDDVQLEDPAIVLNTNIKPDLVISKTVDANNDASFTEIEDISANGSVVTWQVEVSNRGNGPATNIVMVDRIENGLEFVPDSIREVAGDSAGVAQYNDGEINWVGDLGPNEIATVQFQTRVVSAVEFTECNFSDGDATDNQCSNSAVLSLVKDGNPIDEDSAHITTSLSTVLAYTGSSRNISTFIVGGAIAFVAGLLMVGAYASRGGKGGDSGSGPMNTHVPQILMPQ